jgi:DNA-binding beta-propeller fold protein YncE
VAVASDRAERVPTALSGYQTFGRLTSALIASAAVVLAACSSGPASNAGSAASPTGAASRPPQGQPVDLGGGPQASVLDPATATLYEVSENGKAPGTVAVINAATCNAQQAAGCLRKPLVTKAGVGSDAIALDQATNTVYVGSNNTLSVINGAACNARHTAGCKGSWPTVQVGPVVAGIAVDEATDTVYVATWGNGKSTALSVINGATCNGRVSSGCGQAPAPIAIGRSPDGVIFDPASNSVYAVTVGPNLTEALWAIDAATCTTATMSACVPKSIPVTLGTGSNEFSVGLAVDQASRTLYLANFASNTVSMISTSRCNATDTSGCRQLPLVAATGSGPDGIATDAATHTVYITSANDTLVRIYDTENCNANVGTGCHLERQLTAGDTPQSVTVDQMTDTVYVANGDDADMSMFNGATCNATSGSGCL